MSRTKHFQTRMTQRGITEEIISLVQRFGAFDDLGRIVLNQKTCQSFSTYLGSLKRKLDQITEHGGYVVIEKEGCLITTYRLNRSSESKTKTSRSRSNLKKMFIVHNKSLQTVIA